MATRVLLIRHAQSEWNAIGKWQGWADPPLSEAGTAACRLAGRDEHLDEVDAAASSDLCRARASAELLAEGRGWDPVLVLRGLRERGAGKWTGLTRDEIERGWPGALRFVPASIPDGESVGAVTARAVAALHRIAELYPGRSVVAVSHGALIRALAHHLSQASAAVPNLGGPVPNLGGMWLEVTSSGLRGRAVAGPLGAGVVERL